MHLERPAQKPFPLILPTSTPHLASEARPSTIRSPSRGWDLSPCCPYVTRALGCCPHPCIHSMVAAELLALSPCLSRELLRVHQTAEGGQSWPTSQRRMLTPFPLPFFLPSVLSFTLSSFYFREKCLSFTF